MLSRSTGGLSRRFFDGATHDDRCGCGAWLRINAHIHFLLYLYWVLGSNSNVELLALWGLLVFAKYMQLKNSVYGDSRSTIESMSRKSFSVPSLVGWMDHSKTFIGLFDHISISHVYMELNLLVDGLSKQWLGTVSGLIHFRFLVDVKVMKERNLEMP